MTRLEFLARAERLAHEAVSGAAVISDDTFARVKKERFAWEVRAARQAKRILLDAADFDPEAMDD